jgi:hypothetical protein
MKNRGSTDHYYVFNTHSYNESKWHDNKYGDKLGVWYNEPGIKLPVA